MHTRNKAWRLEQGGYLEDVTASCATESYALRDSVAVTQYCKAGTLHLVSSTKARRSNAPASASGDVGGAQLNRPGMA